MASNEDAFQIFIKPVGAGCNLRCTYCYYLDKEDLISCDGTGMMSDSLLERLIIQHIEATDDRTIRFAWHGGEPTLLGLEKFRKIAALQQLHLPENRQIVNGIQTNGTLLTDAWCRFFSEANFTVGISLDGPKELNDRFRKTRQGGSSFRRAVGGVKLLKRYAIPFEILCVVHAENVRYPLDVYTFFKQLGAEYISFLPLVERRGERVTKRSVPAESWGAFLCEIFDVWKAEDIGRIKIQIFEEAARTAFRQEHTLCIFKKRCGRVPVIELNGDVYSCDHFVDPVHRIGNILHTPLIDLLNHPSQRAFGQAKIDTLPGSCIHCPVLDMCNGGCPKNRFLTSKTDEAGLNYLCAGYRRFFLHAEPWIDQIARIWRNGQHA